MEYVSPEGLRLDGRRPKELRALRAELGVLLGADGSAAFEMGNTKVLAAVYGPREADRAAGGGDDPGRATLRCEYAVARFATGERRRRGGADRRATEAGAAIEAVLRQTVQTELLPRAQIDVFVQVLQADGGTRCAALNAAVLALADAGVPMVGAAAACAAGHLDGHALLDMNYVEDAAGGPEVTVALHPGTDSVVLLQADGRLGADAFDEVSALAAAGARAVAGFMREKQLEHAAALAGAAGRGAEDLPQ